MPKLLFRTIHGSHLYGLAHAASDTDWYEVWDELDPLENGQVIDGGQDTTRVSLPEFMHKAGTGVPQALEALFAPDDAVEVDAIRWLRHALTPGTAETANRYVRAIQTFSASASPKVRRHAARLGHDLGTFLATGRIYPRAFALTPQADPALYGLPARAPAA